jgi:hypothetical protein
MTRRFTSRNFINTDKDLADTLQRYLDIHTDAVEILLLTKHARMSGQAKASLNALIEQMSAPGATKESILQQVEKFISSVRKEAV